MKLSIKLPNRSEMAAAQTVLDTVQITGNWRMRRSLPPGWTQLEKGVSLRVGALGDCAIAAQCSLPSLLFGHNGRVLKNQQELDAAFEAMRQRFDSFADLGQASCWDAWRLDLAWNFDLPAKQFAFAHAALRVPHIQSDATLHKGGQGVSWLASRSRFGILLYDKCAKMRVPGSVLRAEVTLRGEQLTNRFGERNWRDFDVQWNIFSTAMGSIPSIAAPTQAENVWQAIGLETREVRERIFARLGHKPCRTLRRWRKSSEEASSAIETFAWGQLLSDGPTAPVTVEPRRRVL